MKESRIMHAQVPMGSLALCGNLFLLGDVVLHSWHTYRLRALGPESNRVPPLAGSVDDHKGTLHSVKGQEGKSTLLVGIVSC